MSIGEFPISGYWVEMSHGLKSLLGVRGYHMPIFLLDCSWDYRGSLRQSCNLKVIIHLGESSFCKGR